MLSGEGACVLLRICWFWGLILLAENRTRQECSSEDIDKNEACLTTESEKERKLHRNQSVMNLQLQGYTCFFLDSFQLSFLSVPWWIALSQTNNGDVKDSWCTVCRRVSYYSSKSILIKSCYHLETPYEMSVCVSLNAEWICRWGTFQHRNYIYKTDQATSFHQQQCRGSPGECKQGLEEIQLQVTNITITIYTVFLIWTWFFLPRRDICKAMKSSPSGRLLSWDCLKLESEILRLKLLKLVYLKGILYNGYHH